MKRLLFVSLALLAALGASGCSFWKKSSKPKPSTEISTDVEKEFKVRWIARRVSDLEASGVKDGSARQQAENEFRERFEYLGDKRK